MATQQLVRFDTGALNKALLGFDSLFGNFEERFTNQVKDNYPPYNIIKHDENSYELEIAVTGFSPEEITVEIDQNQLVVKGERKSENGQPVTEREEIITQLKSAGKYLHRGLATRPFARSWTLAEHMEVGEGTIKNGVLKIELKRIIPESLKPRLLKLKAE